MAQLATRVEFLEEKIMDALETVKDNQERMCSDIGKIKEAVYHPDSGLYARLRVLEEEKKTQSKFLWLLVSMVIGTLGALAVTYFKS